DIFKRVMYYGYKEQSGRYTVIMMDPVAVANIYEANKRSELPDEFEVKEQFQDLTFDQEEHQFEKDLTGVIELPDEKPGKRKYRNKNRKGGNKKGRKGGSKRRSGPRKDRGSKSK